jgi:hypothetical protein
MTGRRAFLLLLCGLVSPGLAQSPIAPQHVSVWREANRYGGWPANHGIWIWGSEILVGFSAGHMKLGDPNRHPIDRERAEEHLLARSLDGGQSWKIEKAASLKPPPQPGHMAGVPTESGGKPPSDLTEPMPFTAPGFAMTVRYGDIHTGPSWFYYSTDRGKSWRGPHTLPAFGQKALMARTDYIVDGPQSLTMFLTAAKANDREGRVICLRTTDGGKTWSLAGTVGPEPEGNDYAIMPASVRLSASSLLTAVRHRRWIDTWRSDDNGATWQSAGRAVPDTGRGNPPGMIRLKDGRLALTYGFRGEPYGIRARISRDEGKTWSEDIVLRADAADWDLGYTRSVQRGDGKVVTVYYYNDTQSPERYIAATIWQP